MSRPAATTRWALLLAATLAGGTRAQAGTPPAALAPAVRFAALPAGEGGYVGALPEIYVEGPIAETTLAGLRQIVDQQGLATARVLFDSEGGDLLAAIEIGRFLRERGFVTEVAGFSGAWGRHRPAVCHSACAVAYVGGRYRYLDPASRIGVHQFATPREEGTATLRQVEQEAQSVAARLVDYLRDMGVDVALFGRMSRRPHEDIEYLGRSDLLRLGVVNDGRMAPQWRLAIDGDAVVLSGRQERIDNAASVTLRCGDPLVVDFATEGYAPGWKAAVESGGARWILGGASFAVDGGSLAAPASIEGGRFRLGVRATAAQAALLPAANSIGLEIDEGGKRYEFEVDTGGGASREDMDRFVRYCARVEDARVAAAAAGG